MLMYKVKNKTGVFLYKDLCECQFINEIVEKPEEFEITELYLDMYGIIQIKRPIMTRCIQRFYYNLNDERNKLSNDKIPIQVKVGYPTQPWYHEYQTTCRDDDYMMAVKIACMITRAVPISGTGLGASGHRYSVYCETRHPALVTKRFQLSQEEFEHIGEIKGRMVPFHELNFKDARLIDCLPEKTVQEQLLIQDLTNTIPSWRQGAYIRTNVQNEFSRRSRSPLLAVASNEYFVPTNLCLNGEVHDLELLVSN